ncbi:MAG: trypsin-like peptidase domain-containing protein [Armatimonas sp.]
MKNKLFMYGGTLLAGVGLGACVAKSPSVSAVVAPPATRAEAVPGYDAGSEPIVKVVQKVAPAIVSIDTTAKVTGYVRTGFFDDPQRVTKEIPRGQGSGVLLEGGYVLTNEHVVGDALSTGGKVTIHLTDKRTFVARPVGADHQSDIALLKIEGSNNLPYALPGVEDKLLPGQQVIAIGNPVGLSASVSSGIVSALGRPLETEGRVYENLIQTDTAINPGNSGGALIDMGGRVVGINTLVRSDAQNIGFAIPIQTAMRIADEIKRNGSVQRPDLGFTVTEFEASQGEIPDGIAIINPRGQAASVLQGARQSQRRGMMEVHDVLLSVNGKPTPTVDAFRKVVSTLKVGQQAEVTIWRDGQMGKTRIPVVTAS